MAGAQLPQPPPASALAGSWRDSWKLNPGSLLRSTKAILSNASFQVPPYLLAVLISLVKQFLQLGCWLFHLLVFYLFERPRYVNQYIPSRHLPIYPTLQFYTYLSIYLYIYSCVFCGNNLLNTK